jgi:two-component system cell cycle response regulator
MCKFLNNSGYSTITASNGIEAIEKTFRDRPDLIILDVIMPRMNGFQTCRLLKSDPETCHIPVVMLTAKDQTSDKYWGIQTGADFYLSKEFGQATLVATIENLLQKRPRTSHTKSLIRENTLISAVDIVSKVNDLLDKKLFEATVLNEMNSLIEKGIENYKGVVDVVINTLAKIIDFNVAVIVTIEEQCVECFYKINRTVSRQYLGKLQGYVKAYLKENDVYLSSSREMTIYDDDNKIKQSGESAEQVKIGFFDVPVKYANKLGGLIVLANSSTDRIDKKDADFFRTVIKQGYVIIENSWLYNKIKKVAITDSLTGIYNHGFLYERLCEEYARTERHKLPLTFLMIDLDFFKKVNDTHGHLKGDDVLCKLAQIIKKNIRSYDIVGRYGGEEFSVILPEATMKDGAAMAERIRSEVAAYDFGNGPGAIRCTVSIGASASPCADIKNIEDLIRKADQALYKAKDGGRNRVCTL